MKATRLPRGTARNARGARRLYVAAALLALFCAGCHDIEYAPRPTVQQPAPAALTRVVGVASPPELPPGGGVTTVFVETSSGGSSAVRGVEVELRASAGVLSDPRVTTDATGHARVTWTIDRTATLTLSAQGVSSETTVVVRDQ